MPFNLNVIPASFFVSFEFSLMNKIPAVLCLPNWASIADLYKLVTPGLVDSGKAVKYSCVLCA